MALAKDVNSYVSAEEADAYFGDRLDVAAWSNANATMKDQSLVTATQVLDDLDWTGTAISESQPLAFPRSGYYFDPRAGIQITLSATASPERIKRATIELAHHLLNNEGLLDDNGSVKDLSIGSISLTTTRVASLVPDNVKRIIKPLLINAGSNNWWRAN